jgi:hypothetical protein
MNVTEAESIAEKNELVPLIREKFSKETLKKFTEVLKGFRPREEDKEKTQEEWYNKFKSRITSLKEFQIIINDLTEEVINRNNLNRGDATGGVIGAIRFLQEEFGFRKNFNGHKNDAMKTLLLYEIKQFELTEN